MTGRHITLTFKNEEDADWFERFIDGTYSDLVESYERDHHTPHELYEHRYTLFRALVFTQTYRLKSWRAKLHHDGTMFDDSFIVGINLELGHSAYSSRRNDVTYHLPLSWWDKFESITTFERAPEFDGASPAVTVERLNASADLYQRASRWPLWTEEEANESRQTPEGQEGQ